MCRVLSCVYQLLIRRRARSSESSISPYVFACMSVLLWAVTSLPECVLFQSCDLYAWVRWRCVGRSHGAHCTVTALLRRVGVVSSVFVFTGACARVLSARLSRHSLLEYGPGCSMCASCAAVDAARVFSPTYFVVVGAASCVRSESSRTFPCSLAVTLCVGVSS